MSCIPYKMLKLRLSIKSATVHIPLGVFSGVLVDDYGNCYLTGSDGSAMLDNDLFDIKRQIQKLIDSCEQNKQNKNNHRLTRMIDKGV